MLNLREFGQRVEPTRRVGLSAVRSSEDVALHGFATDETVCRTRRPGWSAHLSVVGVGMTIELVTQLFCFVPG